MPRNVSIILSPEPGYSLMQFRDDIPAREPLQFFGGWLKGYYPKYENPDNEEAIGLAINRELINELGLCLNNVFFLPFPNISDYIYYKNRNTKCIVYLTYGFIDYAWIINKENIKDGQQIVGQLNLREGSRMDVFKLDEFLLKMDLFENDRRMLRIFLENKDNMFEISYKINTYIDNVSKDLKKLITVFA